MFLFFICCEVNQSSYHFFFFAHIILGRSVDGRVHSDLCAGDALQEAARAEGDMKIQPSVTHLLICSLIYSAACFALPLIHPLTSFLALLLTVQCSVLLIDLHQEGRVGH